MEKEYENESLNYCFAVPKFEATAALWAAKTIYTATQLMLYRENKDSDIQVLLPAYDSEITPSVLLSADLVLRFLPDVISNLKAIDPEDKLIEILENHLLTFFYSGVNYSLPINELKIFSIPASPCLYQLYIDRIIEYKKIELAKHPLLVNGVKSSLGMYAGVYWKEFQQSVTIENGSN